MNQDPLVIILQTAISPMALISGVGLLVLSMTNRFGRTTDRARALFALRQEADDDKRALLDVQIRILYRRSSILLRAISAALICVLLVGLLIIVLFLTFLLAIDLRSLAVGLFVSSIGCLLLSLVLFIQDIGVSLKALKRELGDLVC